MFNLHGKLQYFLYPAPVDMRKSFYTLSGIVSSVMKRNVQDGEAFIFVNRNMSIMKVLHLEHGGLVIYHKRLENGTFTLPRFDEDIVSQQISWQELMMIVDNVKPIKRRLKKRQKSI